MMRPVTLILLASTAVCAVAGESAAKPKFLRALHKVEAAQSPVLPIQAPPLPEEPNLFPRQSWQPPPPPPLPPPKPTAPPLPFQYRGQMEEGNALRIFVAQQQKQLIVQLGDLIDGVYRVDEVTPQWVTFIYLPLNEKQRLNTGRTQ